MAEIIDDARFEMNNQGKTIRYDECDSAISIHGNYELLRRAIENILRNAIKHTPNNSCVEITSTLDNKTKVVSIKICDYGPGVHVEEMDAIFEPFFRGRNSVNTHGYGLGLSIANRVIIAHGGKLHAKNRTDGGLCVTVDLPIS
jgi:two-component system OmpR family sensor kinase